ncbi:MAG: transporter substrate-binding domain-containing protein [Tissierellia bacterium]|nr:transporter substrate-binding domain-containing protein [Tissierellia bacterium]
MIKKYKFLAVLMVLLVIFAGCSGSEGADKKEDGTDELTVEAIQDKGKIILGTSADYPPFEFHALVDGSDEIVGLDIEIAKYIAESLGVELEINDMDFDSLITALGAGRVDMVIAGMNPDPERDANFSDVYYEANLAVLVMKGNPLAIESESDLADKKIGVQIGTTQEDIANEAGAKEVLSLNSNYDLVMNLKTEKIDCAIMETPVAEAFAKNNGDLVVVEGLEIDSGTDGVAIALKTGNDKLTEKINELLKEIKDKGLLDQWMAEADELSSEEI